MKKNDRCMQPPARPTTTLPMTWHQEISSLQLRLSLGKADMLSECVWLDRLAANVVTPTTKAADHDVPISPAEIVEQGLMSQEDWDSVRL